MSIYARNFSALELVDARTAACLSRLPANKEQPAIDGGLNDYGLKENYSDGDLLLVQGSGRSHEVALALAHENVLIRVLECDASAIVAVLSVIDVSEALLSGRLAWHLLTCNSSVTQEISLRECLSILIDKCHRLKGKVHWLSTTTTVDHLEVYRSLQEGLAQATMRKRHFSGESVAV